MGFIEVVEKAGKILEKMPEIPDQNKNIKKHKKLSKEISNLFTEAFIPEYKRDELEVDFDSQNKPGYLRYNSVRLRLTHNRNIEEIIPEIIQRLNNRPKAYFHAKIDCSFRWNSLDDFLRVKNGQLTKHNLTIKKETFEPNPWQNRFYPEDIPENPFFGKEYELQTPGTEHFIRASFENGKLTINYSNSFENLFDELINKIQIKTARINLTQEEFRQIKEMRIKGVKLLKKNILRNFLSNPVEKFIEDLLESPEDKNQVKIEYDINRLQELFLAGFYLEDYSAIKDYSLREIRKGIPVEDLKTLAEKTDSFTPELDYGPVLDNEKAFKILEEEVSKARKIIAYGEDTEIKTRRAYLVAHQVLKEILGEEVINQFNEESGKYAGPSTLGSGGMITYHFRGGYSEGVNNWIKKMNYQGQPDEDPFVTFLDFAKQRLAESPEGAIKALAETYHPLEIPKMKIYSEANGRIPLYAPDGAIASDLGINRFKQDSLILKDNILEARINLTNSHLLPEQQYAFEALGVKFY